MSRMTNPDDAMMDEQQAQDLGHPLDPDANKEIKRLPEGVDADGLIRGAQEMPESSETASARKTAAAKAEKAPKRR